MSEGEPKILVVNDNGPHRRATVDHLQKEGFRTDEGSNGESALKIMLEERRWPDLILTDSNQPVFDGYDLVHFLKMRQAFGQGELIKTPQLERHFRPKLDVVERYVRKIETPDMRRKLHDIPVILTSSGDQRQLLKVEIDRVLKDEAGVEERDRDKYITSVTELTYAIDAIRRAEAYRVLDVGDPENLRALVEEIRNQLALACRIRVE